ncbi:MAG: hypothetical protein CVU56_19295 [Deltaproteobacteria bacterium HGW-Deltaproteobacteria-14]|nr:MAG: hypothetical protein CVU56_19295 [Deltaproteobacteria bacterium HGW-Deltaproteobacteria-14]
MSPHAEGGATASADSDAPVTEGGPLPAAIVDLTRGHLVAVNQALANRVGCPPAELIGADHLALFHPDSRAVAAEIAGLVRARGAVTLDGLRLADAPSAAHTVSVRAVLQARSGPGPQAHLVFTETGERMRLESALARARRLEASGRAAVSVAHDLDDLLAVIDMAAFRIEASTPAAVADAVTSLALIHEAVREATQLTCRLREAAVTERDPDHVSVHLSGVVAAMEGALRELVAPARLRLRLDPAAWPCPLPAPAARAVVTALARAATGVPAPVDSVVVELDNLAASGDGTSDVLILRVRADRRGVTAQPAGGGFEPAPPEEAGFELASVRAAVVACGGQLFVCTTPGTSPLFEVRLPRCRRERGVAAGDGDDAPVVMVAEDEPTIRAMVVRWLRDRGYRVLEAQDGPTALEVAAAPGVRIDLLLSDVVMPGMSGPELALRLRGTRPTLRVLFMSAHTSGELSWSEPADGPLLEKPFLGADLVARVAAALT